MKNPNRLSEKSVAVLSLIADGRSYGQITDAHPEISYLDIFGAAEEALRLNGSHSDYQGRLANVKTGHPRAYERWTATEDAQLSAMQAQRKTIAEMSACFQRQPSAIRSRLVRLGLSPVEASR